MTVPSAKALFRATKPSAPKGDGLFRDLPDHVKNHTRDPLDFDPTPPDATIAFLDREEAHIRAHGNTVWEPCVGAGHIAHVLRAKGFHVRAGDIKDRGYSDTFCMGSFYDSRICAAPSIVSNPPYNEINARNGHGKWLRHSLDAGCRYVAYLLNADWAAARINGMDALFQDHPPSIEYLCCWKIDFRGGGAPPQRNSWFVWDENRPAAAHDTWFRTRLYRDTQPRGGLLDAMEGLT